MNARTMKQESRQENQNLAAIDKALKNACGGSFGKIPHGDRNFSDAKLSCDRLRNNILIEDKTVR